MKSGVTDFTENVLLCGAPAGMSRIPGIVGLSNTSILFFMCNICWFMDYLLGYGVKVGLLNRCRFVE